MRWYAVQAKSGEEYAAERNLQAEQFSTFLPMAERNGKQFALFPGYLFIHLDTQVGDWSKIRSTPKVIRLVQFGDTPTPVPDWVINWVRDISSEDEVVHLRSQFQPGDRVQVDSGPLRYAVGVVRGTKKERVQVLFEIMQQDQMIPIHYKNLHKIA